MQCLKKLFEVIDINCFPSCCKAFLVQVYNKKGRLKYDPSLLRSGGDSGPLLTLGFIEQGTDNRVDLTNAARKLID